MTDICVRLLGTVQIDGDGGPTAPYAGRVSTLLAILGMETGRVVSLDRIMQQLWGDDPPPSGRSTLYVYVSRLRSQLESTPLRIVARTPGYVLEAPRSAIDAHVFADLVAAADDQASAAAWDQVLRLAAEAQSLWRGTPFSDTIPGDDLDNEAKRLERLAERAEELAARALLALGRTAEAVRRTEDLVARDPFNETYRRLRMRAEHADGRTAAALATYDEFRRLMSEELGIDPSERMRSLHLDILRASEATDDVVPLVPAPHDPAPLRAEDPVVGRMTELDLLDRAVDAGLAGRGQVVVLEGVAGIGKSRLAEHAADRARDAGAAVVWARAIDGAGTPPLWMWEQALEQLHRVLATGTTGADTLYGFTAGEPGAATPEQARFRLHQRIVTELLELSDRTPIVLVLDDVQWADDGTLQVLRLLAPALRDRACTVIVTARPRSGSGVDVLTLIARETTVHRLVLDPLTKDDVSVMLGGGSPGDDADALWRRSGGNPFFVVELLRTGAGAAVPETIAELFEQRFSVLVPESREMLDLAAVAGRALDPLVLARAAGTSVAEVVRLLEPVRAEGFVTSDQTVRTLAFTHDLAREALLARLAPSRAAALHGRVADAIAEVHADDLTAHLDELADHRFLAVAGSPSLEAFEACMAAADHAAARLAYDQASLHRARALSTLVPGADHRDVRFEVLIELTTERQLSGDAVGAVASMRQALELARLMDDSVLVRRAVASLGEVTLWNWRHFDHVDEETITVLTAILSTNDDVPMRRVPDAERASLLGALAVELYYSGDDRRCRDLAKEAVELAAATGDPVLMGRTLNNFAIAAWFPAYRDERRDMIDRSLALADRGLPQTTELVARLHRAPLHLEDGEVHLFAEHLSRAEWLAARLGRPELEALVAFQRTGQTMLRGDHAEATEMLSRTVRQYSRTSLWGSDWTSLNVRTHMARVDGRLDGVADELTAKAAEDANRTLRWTAVLALAELGDTAQAKALQHRWGLTSMPRQAHWGSPFEWAQAAEVALLLGTPAPADAYRTLAAVTAPLILIGTALAVHGPADALRARLALELGDERAAQQHRRAGLEITAAVEEALGVTPSWPLAVR